MKKIYLIAIGFFLLTLQSGCQQSFDAVVTFNKGFRFSPTGTVYTSLPTGSMTYPAAGIPVSTGSAWGTSIVNNSTNWNTAYGWGNHAGLYKSISWVPSWSEVTEKPGELDLKNAIPLLDYLPIPAKTTAQINALVMPSGASGIVYDSTLKCYKIYQNGTWVTQITNQ
jgi:hypothetical protein